MWNVVNSVNNPKRNDDWCIQTEKGETNDKQIIADTFNLFFKNKIELLKKNIDKDLVEDPLARIKEKMSQNKKKEWNKFSFTLLKETDVIKAMKKMKRINKYQQDNATCLV